MLVTGYVCSLGAGGRWDLVVVVRGVGGTGWHYRYAEIALFSIVFDFLRLVLSDQHVWRKNDKSADQLMAWNV